MTLIVSYLGCISGFIRGNYLNHLTDLSNNARADILSQDMVLAIHRFKKFGVVLRRLQLI